MMLGIEKEPWDKSLTIKNRFNLNSIARRTAPQVAIKGSK